MKLNHLRRASVKPMRPKHVKIRWNRAKRSACTCHVLWHVGFGRKGKRRSKVAGNRCGINFLPEILVRDYRYLSSQRNRISQNVEHDSRQPTTVWAILAVGKSGCVVCCDKDNTCRASMCASDDLYDLPSTIGSGIYQQAVAGAFALLPYTKETEQPRV